MNIFKIPLEELEEHYWQQSGFCTSCSSFHEGVVEIGLSKECPLCREETFYNVSFLVDKGVLVSIV